MKKVILPVACVCLLLTGCWDSVELNDISIVTGMAVDPGEKSRYRLTLEYINAANFSKQAPEQGAPVSIQTFEGNTLPEIASKMNIAASRVLIFSHTRVLFINEKVAREGILGFLDGLERTSAFRNDFNILITKGHAAEDFTKINNPVEKIPSLKVRKQIQSISNTWGGDPEVRLSDFIDAVTSKGRSPVTNTVVLQGDPNKGKKVDSNMSNEREANILLDGLAVFDGSKLLGFLTLEETRNYMWTQDIKNTRINVPCHQHEKDEEENQYVNLFINNSRTEMNTDYRNEHPVLKVNIYTEGQIIETQCVDNLAEINTFSQIEKNAENYIETIIKDTINKVQDEFGVDIFGFGEALNRQHYHKFKEVKENWNEEFKRAEVEINASVQIRRAGIKNRSFMTELPREEVEEE